MEKLELYQMENVEGGRSARAMKAIATAGLVAGVAASFGPIGWAIAGPAAIGMGIASLVCAFKK